MVPFAEITADETSRTCSMKLVTEGREEPFNVRIMWTSRTRSEFTATLLDPPG